MKRGFAKFLPIEISQSSFLDKLQIAPLKFGGIWILYSEISNFEIYPLKFGVFEFYTIRFQNLDFAP